MAGLVYWLRPIRGAHAVVANRFFPCVDTVVAKGKSMVMTDLKRKTAPTSEPQVACNCQNFATFTL